MAKSGLHSKRDALFDDIGFERSYSFAMIWG